MKRLFKSVIAAAIAASCVLSLTSCGFMDFMNKLEKTKNPESSSSVLDSSGSVSDNTESGVSSDDSSSYTDNSSSSGSYSDSCDDKYEDYKKAFDLLLANDIIPVTASGNSGFKEGVQPFGCISGSFTVGEAAMKAMLDKTEESINNSSSEFTLDITVERDAIIYDYKFKEQIPAESLEISKDVAEKSFEDSATIDKLKPLMKLMVQYVKLDNPKLVMQYTNADGSLIFRKVFDKSILRKRWRKNAKT